MPVPSDPPVAVTPAPFRTWALDVSDTVQAHDTRIGTLEADPAGVAVEDEGLTVLANAVRFDFTGAGVTVTDGGAGQATVTIPGGSSLPGAWTAYTPTWTATTNPAIGNGTLTGAYVQFGKTVHFRFKLLFGSTTTSGSGAWVFGLPVAAIDGSNYGVNLAGYAEDAGTAGYNIAGGRTVWDAGILLHVGTTGNGYSGTSPFTFGTSDFLSVTGTYEAA